MRVVIQRVKRASVTVEHAVVGSIQRGLLVLIGVTHEDTAEDAEKVAKKITKLRLWPDEADNQWKKTVGDIGGKVLCVSQFTLYANVQKGAKPDFHGAAKGEFALATYEMAKAAIAKEMPNKDQDIQDGSFGAMMDVELVNDGPVTITFDTKTTRSGAKT